MGIGEQLADAREDERWMAEALRAARDAPDVAPNPAVGCIVVLGTEVVGVGHTEPPGGPHAEVNALAEAGGRARGATVYVTLEPCAHHGRTAPCADALIAAGVARVVAAMEDPDPRVAGAGFARLRVAGIAVSVGTGASAVAEHLGAYLHHRRTGRPRCLLKIGMSIDARSAAADGSSQWITSAAARADAHRLRAASQAIVVGPATALADSPALTVRGVEPRPRTAPRRVLLDAHGRVPPTGPLFDTELAPTTVFTTTDAPPAALDAWRTAGVEVVVVRAGADGKGVDLLDVLTNLGERGVLQVMIEGGGRLHGAFLNAGLADRVVTYIAPLLLGANARPAFDFAGPSTLAGAAAWHVVRTETVGPDVRIDYEPRAIAGVGIGD